MSHRFVYVTAKNAKEAEVIGKLLVEKRLAACVNILDNMTSLYRWEGKIRRESETVLIAKTRAELVEPLVRAVKERHGFDNPCVVSLNVDGGSREFLDWIDAETRQTGA